MGLSAFNRARALRAQRDEQVEGCAVNPAPPSNEPSAAPPAEAEKPKKQSSGKK